MRRVKAAKPFYAVFDANGNVTEVGEGDANPQDGETVEWFDTIAERETDSRIGDWRAGLVRARRLGDEVEAKKTSEEYAGKAENAARWMANNPEQADTASLAHTHGDYTEDLYIWLSLEVEVAGKTPRQAATEIMAAVKRDQESDMGTWQQARKRIETREQLKNG